MTTPRRLTDAELEAYLEESLPAEAMTAIEHELRQRPEVLRRLSAILGRREAGVHSVGEIWRRHRLSCPDRQQLGSYLLGVLDNDHAGFVRFHLEGCRFCQANYADLRRQEEETQEMIIRRRNNIFNTTAGNLRQTP
jgi:anti-sigma factor RsiW